jgi:hypothetical protein
MDETKKEWSKGSRSAAATFPENNTNSIYIYQKQDEGEMKIVASPLQSSLFFSSCGVFLSVAHNSRSMRLFFFLCSSTRVLSTRQGKQHTTTRCFRDSVDIRIKLAVFIGFELHFSRVKNLQFCFTFVTHRTDRFLLSSETTG